MASALVSLFFALLANAQTAQACEVFLVPGAFAKASESGASLFITAQDYFADYERFFKAKGCRVGRVEFPADSKVEERARIIQAQFAKFRREPRAAILAHSQGALDARYALHDLGVPGAAALITIGAPHHGTPLADWVLKQREKRTLLYWLFRLIGRYDFDRLEFAGELSASFIEKFAPHFETTPGVAYFSARALCRTDCAWMLRLTSWWIGLPPGDGLIPAESQRFGQDLGEFDLDHLSEVDASEGKRGERERFLRAAWDVFGRVVR